MYFLLQSKRIKQLNNFKWKYTMNPWIILTFAKNIIISDILMSVVVQSINTGLQT